MIYNRCQTHIAVVIVAERQATMSPPVASERPVGPTAASVHGAVVDEVGLTRWDGSIPMKIQFLVGWNGMNIHFNPAMTWGEQKGYRVLTHPHFLPAEFLF